MIRLLILNLNLNKLGKVCLYGFHDATGRAVHTYDGRLLNSQSTLPLPALPSGLYWVQVRTQDQQVFVRRLIIQQ